ncbi:hypothetical protein EBB59_08795 [Lysobacter pythonis]|uniref:Uncharacterized protein n=1 Tax=Solilutibacter pythonis TaxID=2483112 RepID=A0A3M2HUJ0_9GAMM|nr:hypothetical protein [Lysobacter pythonis]RMH91069.1 hypothetical protein EBB59_08795 [Lysobacter pythonis]
MFAQWLHHPYVTRLRARFAARRPRHPLVRGLLGLTGLALLLVLLVVGALLGLTMLLGAAVLRGLRQRGRPRAGGQVIEGEYRSVRDSALPHPR